MYQSQHNNTGIKQREIICPAPAVTRHKEESKRVNDTTVVCIVIVCYGVLINLCLQDRGSNKGTCCKTFVVAVISVRHQMMLS